MGSAVLDRLRAIVSNKFQEERFARGTKGGRKGVLFHSQSSKRQPMANPEMFVASQ